MPNSTVFIIPKILEISHQSTQSTIIFGERVNIIIKKNRKNYDYFLFKSIDIFHPFIIN